MKSRPDSFLTLSSTALIPRARRSNTPFTSPPLIIHRKSVFRIRIRIIWSDPDTLQETWIRIRVAKKNVINIKLVDFRLDPDPLFPEVDPQIRIHIKMKRIRNTVEKENWNAIIKIFIFSRALCQPADIFGVIINSFTVT